MVHFRLYIWNVTIQYSNLNILFHPGQTTKPQIPKMEIPKRKEEFSKFPVVKNSEYRIYSKSAGVYIKMT